MQQEVPTDRRQHNEPMTKLPENTRSSMPQFQHIRGNSSRERVDDDGDHDGEDNKYAHLPANASFTTQTSQYTTTSIASRARHSSVDAQSSHETFDPSLLQMPPADEFKRMYKNLLTLQQKQRRDRSRLQRSREEQQKFHAPGVEPRASVDGTTKGTATPRDSFVVDYNDNDANRDAQNQMDPEIVAAAAAAVNSRSWSSRRSSDSNGIDNKNANISQKMIKNLLHSYSLLLSLAGGSAEVAENSAPDDPPRTCSDQRKSNIRMSTRSSSCSNTAEHDHPSPIQLATSDNTDPAVIPHRTSFPSVSHNRDRMMHASGVEAGDSPGKAQPHTHLSFDRTRATFSQHDHRLKQYNRYLSLLPSPLVGVAFAVVLVIFIVLMATK